MSGLVMAGVNGVAPPSSEDEYLLLDFPKLFSEQPQLLSQPLAALLSLRFMDGRRSGQGALGLIGDWLRSVECEELRRTILAWVQYSLPGEEMGSIVNLGTEEERQMLIMRLRTPDFDTMDEVRRYNTTMNGMEDVLAQQLRKKFGAIPDEYASRLSIAIDKDFKVYADRILDAKTIVEVFEPDPAEDE
ncbi:hypothetical protein [Pseudoduganella sp.]|uniref:hypothetical protein n=1 Tax=Pseudoduganella sp. TaxID=1880898 RepID=UPI0035AEA9DF